MDEPVNELLSIPHDSLPDISPINILEDDLEISLGEPHNLIEDDSGEETPLRQPPSSPTGDFKPGIDLDRERLAKTFQFLKTMQETYYPAKKPKPAFKQPDFDHDIYEIDEEETISSSLKEGTDMHNELRFSVPKEVPAGKQISIKPKQTSTLSTEKVSEKNPEKLTDLVDANEVSTELVSNDEIQILENMTTTTTLIMEGKPAGDEKEMKMEMCGPNSAADETRNKLMAKKSFTAQTMDLPPVHGDHSESPQEAFMHYIYGADFNTSLRDDEDPSILDLNMRGSCPLVCLGDELLPQLEDECQEALDTARDFAIVVTPATSSQTLPIRLVDSLLTCSTEDEQCDVEGVLPESSSGAKAATASTSQKEASTQVNSDIEPISSTSRWQDDQSISNENDMDDKKKRSKIKSKFSKGKFRKFLCFTIR